MTQNFVITFKNKDGKSIRAFVHGNRTEISIRLIGFIKEARKYGADFSASIISAKNFKQRLK